MRFSDTAMAVKKKSKFKFQTFGFASILLTFVMMCIMTFGVLSLVTANSDLKLSKKVAEKSTGYAEAKELAYQRFTTLDQVLDELYQSRPSMDNFYSILTLKLQETELGNFIIEDYDGLNMEQYRLHWETDITDTQYLSVTVRINSPTSLENGYYTIEGFYTAHKENDTEIIDDTLHLMGD